MDATQSMELYNILMYVCIGISVAGFGLAIFLFFWLKIPVLFAIETGRAQKKTIEEMLNQSSTSGSLRMRKEKGKKNKESAAYTTDSLSAEAAPPPEPPEQQTAVLEQNTTVLERNTTVLNTAPVVQTPSPTAYADEGATEQLGCTPAAAYRFRITEETIVVHTDETI